jgi:serralysin
MEETATPMSNSAVSGAGLVNVDAAVAAATALLPPVVIEAFGSTSLVEVGNNFFFDPVAGGTGPEFKYGGTAVTTGEFPGWSFIGAEQVSGGGYEVALHLAGADEYTLWGTDNNGNVVSNLAGGIVSGTSATLEQLETSFHQDLNGDGTIGPVTTVLESFGSTELVQAGSNYYFNPVAGGTGPEFKFGGTAVTAGEFPGWSFIGAEQVSGGGYEVALHLAGADEYTVWGTDSNGNVVTNLAGGIVSGTSATLEQLETSFHRDLNGDGTIGPVTTVLESFGSTELVQVGSNYYFNPVAGGTGPEFKYGGTAVTAGEFPDWSFIGAEQVSGGGYEVALHLAGADEYTVWGTDSNGNVVTNLAGGIVSGTSATLEQLETSFHQDLNGDGTIGPTSSSGSAVSQVASSATPAASQASVAASESFVFSFSASTTPGGSATSNQETFEFDGAAAQAAFNQLAHIFNAAASEGAFLMQVASGDHDATAYFASLEGSSAANVHVIQTAPGFIIQ